MDNINHPSHYADGKIEVIDYIEDKNLGFCLGNAVKYISRAGKKDPNKYIEDLGKAAWYINRKIFETAYKSNDMETMRNVIGQMMSQVDTLTNYMDTLQKQQDKIDNVDIYFDPELGTETTHISQE